MQSKFTLKMSSRGQTRTVWHPQKGSKPSDSSGQVTRSEPARSTTLSLGDSVTPGLLMVCWSASQHFLECIPSPLPAWLWWDDLTQNRVCNICCSEVWDLAMVHSTFCPVFAASKTRSRLEIRSWKIAWLRLEAFEKSRWRRNVRIIMEYHGLSDYPVGGWFVTFAGLPNEHKWAVEITTIGELVQPHHELIWTFRAKSMVPKRHEHEGQKKIQKND